LDFITGRKVDIHIMNFRESKRFKSIENAYLVKPMEKIKPEINRDFEKIRKPIPEI